MSDEIRRPDSPDGTPHGGTAAGAPGPVAPGGDAGLVPPGEAVAEPVPPVQPAAQESTAQDPAQGQDAGPEAVEAATAASAPVETATAETEPVEAATADAEPVEAATADAEPVEAGPAHDEPLEAEPVAAEPVSQAAEEVVPGTPEGGQSADADEPGEVQALEPSAGAGEPDEDSLRLAEALVFASAEPVTARGLQRLLPDTLDAEAVLAALRQRYAGRGVELVEAAGGVMFRSAPDLAPRLRKVIEAPRRLPRVAMETLAIIAYHQPMTRPEIEHIRGSALSQQTLDSLLELSLIAPKGRRETPGRPTLWGTTPEFLSHFGLKDLRELPRREDLLLEPVPPRPETVTPDLRSPEDTAPAAAAAEPPSGDEPPTTGQTIG